MEREGFSINHKRSAGRKLFHEKIWLNFPDAKQIMNFQLLFSTVHSCSANTFSMNGLFADHVKQESLCYAVLSEATQG